MAGIRRPGSAIRNGATRVKRTVGSRSAKLTASWHGVLAKVERAVVSGDELLLTIRSDGSIAKCVKDHDRIHAQVSALVFSKQSQFANCRKVRGFVEDLDGRRAEIRIDVRETEEFIADQLVDWDDDRQRKLPIPAPLIGFLAKNCR